MYEIKQDNKNHQFAFRRTKEEWLWYVCYNIIEIVLMLVICLPVMIVAIWLTC